MKCMFCDAVVSPGSQYCYNCGAEVGTGIEDQNIVSVPQDLFEKEVPAPMGRTAYSTGFSSSQLVGATATGTTDQALFPSGNPVADLHKVKGWNWGAFVFSWIWAFCHNLKGIGIIALVASFFYLGIIAQIYLGINGNELAWKARRFSSVEEFKEVQRKWATAAFIFLFFFLGLIFLGIIGAIFEGR